MTYICLLARVCLFPLFGFQGSESQVSISEMSSESASSFQSAGQGSSPEILVGLVYNATTGRLSVEIIKGSHFKNLAANKPPSKYAEAVYCQSRAVQLKWQQAKTQRQQCVNTSDQWYHSHSVIFIISLNIFLYCH